MNRRNDRGFTLAELVIALAIIATLGGLLMPAFLGYISSNQRQACVTNREGLLAIFERQIYKESSALEQDDLENFLASTTDEVKQYKKCSKGGTYTGRISGATAYIDCSCGTHTDEVSVNFAGFSGTDLGEGIDKPFPTPTPYPTPTPVPTGPAEPTPTPTGITYPVWPYEDDSRWDGQNHTGGSVRITVPTGLFRSKEGNMYVVVDNGSGYFDVHYMWRIGPEYIDQAAWDRCVAYSGVTITDLDTILRDYEKGKTWGAQIYGDLVHYGDIVVIDGVKWIWGNRNYDGEWKSLPENNNVNCSNGFYRVDPK